MKREKICAVCRQPYKYCPHCREDKDKPTWYFTFCSSNCKNIYDATSSYENGNIPADEAKKILDKLDLSKIVPGTSYSMSVEKINTNLKKKVDVYTKKEVKETVEKTVHVEKSFKNAKENNKKANNVE